VRLGNSLFSINKRLDKTLKDLSDRKDKLEAGDSMALDPVIKAVDFKKAPAIASGNIYNINNSRSNIYNVSGRNLSSLYSGKIQLKNRSPYDYKLINSMLVDGYVLRSDIMYGANVKAQGYNIICDNPDDVTYIKDYLTNIAESTEIGLDDYIIKAVHSLRFYGVLFTSISRDKSNIDHRWVDNSNYYRYPINGFYVEDPATINIVTKSKPFKITGFIQDISESSNSYFGEPSGYVEMYNRSSVRFINNINKAIGSKKVPAWNTRDMYYDYVSYGMTSLYPLPPLYPALEDIRSLRDIETIIDTVLYQYGFPLIHVTSDLPGYDQAIKSANLFVRKLEKLESNGAIASGSDVTVKVVKLKENLIDLIKYAEYYSKRLFIDLGVIPILFGDSDSASRSNADILIKVIDTYVEYYQDIIVKPINRLLYEIIQTKYPNRKLPRSYVKFEFNRVNVTTKIKEDSHYLNLYQGNLITRSEAREKIGFSVEMDDSDTFSYHTGKVKDMTSTISQNVNKTGKNQYGGYDPSKASVNK